MRIESIHVTTFGRRRVPHLFENKWVVRAYKTGLLITTEDKDRKKAEELCRVAMGASETQWLRAKENYRNRRKKAQDTVTRRLSKGPLKLSYYSCLFVKDGLTLSALIQHDNYRVACTKRGHAKMKPVARELLKQLTAIGWKPFKLEKVGRQDA